jgi:DNA modification methylase
MNATIHQGDCLEVLKTLPEQSVNCCVTSPPYFGLRDYGTAKWEGGDSNCDHVQSLNKHGGERADRNQEGYKKLYLDVCGKCGARRIDSQIGLEETPDAFVAKLVDVFREVKRVLREDGTLWLNLGDSYAAQRGGTHQPAETLAGGVGGKTDDGGKVNRDRHDGYNPTRFASRIGLKHKDLIGIPWRVAFALQADGWYLRQDIIWHKPNPMPESVTDRCTKAHEYIFLLSKSARYYYDAEAIKEESIYPVGSRDDVPQGVFDGKRDGSNGMNGSFRAIRNTRNKRSVWTITTKPYAGAHFATFPPDLIEPCILAGCPRGGTVLDPFNGSGTAGMVSLENGRNYVGIELNPEYVELTNERLKVTQPTMF